ncbi:hypothetical protein GCM10007907_23470 [Chitinimonas prasina]|uniref:Uncharacterized protein n=1 Tax=Chitinimonas prasina TaxID=1434937 RepID=A0ABQ5YIR0_9NEIS|nr:hypothetical protein [Chitinimonas prasina]GLR13557.1 hypothetical protein GCM10007907_23470 [Chitinimonas prasina]
MYRLLRLLCTAALALKVAADPTPFNPETGYIDLPSVQVGEAVYSVTLRLIGDRLHITAIAPASDTANPLVFNLATNSILLPEVSIGLQTYCVELLLQSDGTLALGVVQDLGKMASLYTTKGPSTVKGMQSVKTKSVNTVGSNKTYSLTFYNNTLMFVTVNNQNQVTALNYQTQDGKLEWDAVVDTRTGTVVTTQGACRNCSKVTVSSAGAISFDNVEMSGFTKNSQNTLIPIDDVSLLGVIP